MKFTELEDNVPFYNIDIFLLIILTRFNVVVVGNSWIRNLTLMFHMERFNVLTILVSIVGL